MSNYREAQADMNNTTWTLCAPFAAALLAAGCASAPPAAPAIAAGGASIEAARAGGATELASSEIDAARRKLDQARTLAAAGDQKGARRLAEEADIDAQLARGKASSERSQRAVSEIEASLQSLREEMARAAAPTARPVQ